ncbi:MAG TPA: hypothetical protein VFT96_00315 [Gemmatimonadaceae bacterium]|nr:hypothetical protein [Gemmatimonadaceae bacterium]
MKRTLAALMLVILGPAVAHAQQARCDVEPKATTRQSGYQLPSGAINTFLGGGAITMRCPTRGITLVADSIEYYGDEQRVFLVGNVSYAEPRLRVNADYITYFTSDERVVASGNVVSTLPNGSTLRGPQAEYRRASVRVRPVAEVEAVGRPTVTIAPGAAGARPGAARPDTSRTTVTANRLFMHGDSLLYASGQVEIARPDLGASGDSVFMNTVTEYMRLMRRPVINGKSGRPFRLTGDLIDLHSRDRQLDRVLSQGNAQAVSEDVTLNADTVQFRVAEELLQAAVAWGKSRRSTAVSTTQRIEADSIDVQMPQQRMQRLTALGAAYTEADPDTTRFRTTEKDWLRGDTIVARFDTVGAPRPDSLAPVAGDTTRPLAVADTVRPSVVPPAPRAAGDTGRPALQIVELLALGSARSYQHLPPADSAQRCPAINYVRGDSIRVTFDSGEVRTVRVINEESASGVLAEPDSTCGRTVAPAPAPTPAQTPPGSIGRRRGNTPTPQSPPPRQSSTKPASPAPSARGSRGGIAPKPTRP